MMFNLIPVPVIIKRMLKLPKFFDIGTTGPEAALNITSKSSYVSDFSVLFETA